MQNNYSKNKQLASKQERFISSLEAIGDILVFETTRRNRNKNVLKNLKKIRTVVSRLFELQRTSPDKFESLILSQEFFELFKEDEKEAQLRLSLQPEKYLISFSTAINQLIRIHEAAIEAKNEEISRHATYHLNFVLSELSQSPNNQLFIEQVLQSLHRMTRIAIQKNDASVYASSINWYIDIVFNKLHGEGKFNLAYLEVFDRYFFSAIKNIVARNETGLFKALVSSLCDGIHVASHGEGKIWDYGHLLLRSDISKYQQLDLECNFEKRLRELNALESDVDSLDKLNGWLKKFNELKTFLSPVLSDDQRQSADKLESEILEFVEERFKYNNLLEVTFAIGAFCLFQNKFEYIKYLLEYHQPPDSDAIWVGEDIVPNSVEKVISFYFRKGLFERKFNFWEDHHGSEKYYKKYFLFLLARLMQPIPQNDASQTHAFRQDLPKLNVYRLSDVRHSIDELVEISNELKLKSDLFAALNIKHPEKLFDEKVIPFLVYLKDKATDGIDSLLKNGSISSNKVDDFKKNFVDGFHSNATIRSILKYYSLFENKIGEQSNLKNRLGINTFIDKGPFLEEWYVHYNDWASDMGRNFASSENKYLVGQFEMRGRKVEGQSLDDVLNVMGNLSNAVIICGNVLLFRSLEGNQKFIPKWRNDVKAMEVSGFYGWYVFNNEKIPVIQSYTERKHEKNFLFLDLSHFGKLVQHSPLNNSEDEREPVDIFDINIEAYNETSSVFSDLLNKPPEWLLKIGNRKQQVDYLKERVLLQIYEKIEFVAADECKIYIMTMSDAE